MSPSFSLSIRSNRGPRGAAGPPGWRSRFKRTWPRHCRSSSRSCAARACSRNGSARNQERHPPDPAAESRRERRVPDLRHSRRMSWLPCGPGKFFFGGPDGIGARSAPLEKLKDSTRPLPGRRRFAQLRPHRAESMTVFRPRTTGQMPTALTVHTSTSTDCSAIHFSSDWDHGCRAK